ncbi:zinc-binding dehydrogenase [Halorubrum sp. CBA1125]|uniref:bi-domain-containing oxidoreductase n=1 Tax=Halorubrum sp. CBA1125 TaxID=2668072 RepID=UPI0012E72007|nr:bi-domain-containing oxidoreductase [Halorubrum sp. CBA1125]MUW13228.1 zinc-binding dehydrogenase [Halorubrum sp. CBA1125]
MKQVIQDFKTGDVRIADVPRPQVDAGNVLVQTHYSCVSAGTEKSMIELGKKNYLGKARERPDLAKKVLDKARNDGLISTYKAVMARLEEAQPLGYSCSGEVIAVGSDVEEFSVGDFVACAGAGYANHGEVVSVPKNLCTAVPEGVDLADAAFVTIGAIAMQGIRRADLTPGERVAVLGLGLVGQTATQILDAYGFPVLGIDIDPAQVERGLNAGATEGAVIGDDDVGAAVEAFSDGHGVDATLIAASTSSDEPVEMAGKITREQGRVSVVGQVGMDVPREVYYDKELDFRISRSYGPGRYDRNYEENGLDYPIGYVRWTENRNMRECLRLLADDRVNFEPLRTHQFSIDNATDAYELILENPDNEAFTGILLEYDVERKHPTKRPHADRSSRVSPGRTSPLSVGLVGAGSFARGKLLPILTDHDDLELHAVCSGTGVSASSVADEHECAYSTSDYTEIMDDADVDMVVVATRHDLHAEVATAALEAGKDVHVEKPLAINEDGLGTVAAAARESDGRLMVGFNRRFAPAAREMKAVSDGPSPVMLTYRVNADKIPADHWINDPEEGGGRVVGEVCHFVDFARFVADASIEQVSASTADEGAGLPQNVQITLTFEDGSTAGITYTTFGDSSLAKEYAEAFGNGQTATVDNFTGGWLSFGQDKGHEAEFDAFVDAILAGDPSPLPLEQTVEVTEATFGINKSLRTTSPVDIEVEDYL